MVNPREQLFDGDWWRMVVVLVAVAAAQIAPSDDHELGQQGRLGPPHGVERARHRLERVRRKWTQSVLLGVMAHGLIP